MNDTPQAANGRVRKTSNSNNIVCRFTCIHPGCGKQFVRKEHLGRHAKQHRSDSQYQCPKCEKRFARSDVLKRHVDQHPQTINPRRTLVACVSCHERKLKCDDGLSCQPCIKSSSSCIRPQAGWSTAAIPPNNVDSQIQFDIQTEQPSASNDPGQPSTLAGDVPWMPLDTLSTPEAMLSAATVTQSTFSDDSMLLCLPNGSYTPTGTTSIMAPGEFSVSMLTSIDASRGNFYSDTCVSDTDFSGSIESQSLSSKPTEPTTSSCDNATSNTIECMDRASTTMRRLIDTYFNKVHVHWPILHQPTFEIETSSHTLLLAMIMLASYHEGGEHHSRIIHYVYQAVLAAHVEPELSISDLQASVLCIVYALLNLRSEGMSAKAHHITSVLISACRYRGVFDGKFTQNFNSDDPFDFWLQQEQAHRLAFAVLQLDAYFSILAHHPPSVRYQELLIPLPKSTRLWSASNDEERRQLQWDEPGGREKTLFSIIMHHSLDKTQASRAVFRLSTSDYHLGLCSLQAGAWEAAQDAHSAASDEFVSKMAPGETVQLWRSNLDLWSRKAEDECQLRQRYFSNTLTDLEDLTVPMSLMLRHMSVLKMHAPLDLLQSQTSYLPNPTSSTARQIQAHLRTWLRSPCPRIAVWNAAQIMRVITHESNSPSGAASFQMKPLGVPALLMSAVVTCAFAKFTQTCWACTGTPYSDCVDIFVANDWDDKLVEWRDTGSGFAVWGLSGIPVCQCQFEVLSTMFQRSLAQHGHTDNLSALFTGIFLDE